MCCWNEDFGEDASGSDAVPNVHVSPETFHKERGNSTDKSKTASSRLLSVRILVATTSPQKSQSKN